MTIYYRINFLSFLAWDIFFDGFRALFLAKVSKLSYLFHRAVLCFALAGFQLN